MDTFFEQIVSIKKTPKAVFIILFIWVLALGFSILFFLLNLFGSFTLLIVAAIYYGAYKLCTMLNIEYEYIITNGTLDIDKIINRSSRKRLLSLDLSTVSSIEKYNPAAISNTERKELTIACDIKSTDAYFVVAGKEGNSTSRLVFAPDQRIKSAIVKFAPKYVSNSAFK